MIWGFDIQRLAIYFAFFFGLVGIAIFATWSVLCNITASVIISISTPHSLASNELIGIKKFCVFVFKWREFAF